MRLLELSYDDPAWNLACDEALFRVAEREGGPEVLRFWESPVPFVVLGVSQRFREEVAVDICATDNVPVLRRCSAGGCVLQGPGVLNFSLVLDQEKRDGMATIRSSYCEILGAVSKALSTDEVEVRLDGVSDLTIDGQKISGNAQRRGRRFLLHHGTVLYNANLSDISRWLLEPAVRPDYRGDRTHGAFVRNIAMNENDIRTKIQNAFGTDADSSRPTESERSESKRLATEKYSDEAWNLRR